MARMRQTARSSAAARLHENRVKALDARNKSALQGKHALTGKRPAKHVVSGGKAGKRKSSYAAAGGIAKPKRRWRPGTVALREVRRLQKSPDSVIPFANFRRQVIDAMDKNVPSGDPSPRISREAVKLIRESLEDRLNTVLRGSNCLSIHRGAVTLEARDIKMFCESHGLIKA